MLGVAVDEAAEHARPWVEEAGVTFPVVYDREHAVVEAYGIVNVPTVVWIDEDDRIVRPHDAEFPDDKLIDFHGRESAPHREALRRWVVDGTVPMTPDEARARQMLPTDDEQRARLHHRVGLHLLRAGRTDAAERHFVRAAELSPIDWTIRRGTLPLLGKDSFFSDEFIALYQEWEAAGRPTYEPRR